MGRRLVLLPYVVVCVCVGVLISVARLDYFAAFMDAGHKRNSDIRTFYTIEYSHSSRRRLERIATRCSKLCGTSTSHTVCRPNASKLKYTTYPGHDEIL